MDYWTTLFIPMLIGAAGASYLIRRTALKDIAPDDRKLLMQQLFKTGPANYFALVIPLLTGLAMLWETSVSRGYGMFTFWVGMSLYIIFTRILGFRKLLTLGFSKEFTRKFIIAESITTVLIVSVALAFGYHFIVRIQGR